MNAKEKEKNKSVKKAVSHGIGFART